MAAKVKIEYSEHALERLKQRRVTRRDVSQCLFEGELIGFDIRGRKMNEVEIKNETLVVVFVDAKGGGKTVITAYWKGLHS